MKHTLIASTMAGLIFSACGNAWMNSSEREQTPAALVLKSKIAYDKGEYDKAIEYLEKAYENDPLNENIRLRLSYAYNGKAGMGLLDMIKRLNALNGTTLEAEDDGITQMANIVGFSAAERAELISKIATKNASDATVRTKMSVLRALNDKLTYMHKSWRTICRMVKKSTFEYAVGNDDTVKSGLEIDECKGGVESSENNASANFAAALASMGEGIIVYQTVVDANGDSVIDIQKRADEVNSKIATINAAIAAATTSASMNSEIEKLNTELAELAKIGAEANGEVFLSTMANFKLASNLISDLAGMPEDFKKKLNASIDKFDQSKSVINGFLKNGSGSKNSTLTASTQKAKDALATLNSRVATLSEAEKTETCSKLKSANGNYNSAAGEFGMPGDSTVSNCQ